MCQLFYKVSKSLWLFLQKNTVIRLYNYIFHYDVAWSQLNQIHQTQEIALHNLYFIYVHTS